ncbi:MAG: hypothetical protein ACT6RU_14380 [Aliihoeflea sp.]|uniref:hypothetical protein n=1 Tax=Aliihoeflea sp. TaxID=2608088 RepID=UPI004034DB4D
MTEAPAGDSVVRPPRATLFEFENEAEDLRMRIAAFLDVVARLPGGTCPTDVLDGLLDACTAALAWCDRNRGQALGWTSSPVIVPEPAGLGDFSSIADVLAEGAGITWRDHDAGSLGYRLGRADVLVYQGEGGWYWYDLTSLGPYGGGLAPGPWPNQESAKAKGCFRFIALEDAPLEARRAAIAACPMSLSLLVE